MRQESLWLHLLIITGQQHARGQQGTKLAARYLYEACAGFHFIQLLTEGVPILLLSDPTAVPHASPWDLCAAEQEI